MELVWHAVFWREEMLQHKKLWKITLVCVLLMMLLAGCGNGNTKVVLTTGFGKNEVFRIEEKSCTVPEIMVYLTNIQNQYESVYGKEIWEKGLEGVTLEENVKETVLAQIAQIKTMNLLADSYRVTLTEEEQEKVTQAAAEYFSSLNESEIAGMEIDEELIESLYSEYALADKVYEFIIKDINPEISDDEARTITVEHILIKTYALDGTGKKVPYTDLAKEAAYKEAREILELAKADEADFGQLITEYSQDENRTYSFRQGEMDAAFEKAAFALETDEISDIVESEFGYHIIKCLTTFDREETDSNKIKMVEERKKEVFGEKYDVFVESLTKNINQKLWDSIEFIHDEQNDTTEFFDIYIKHFN